MNADSPAPSPATEPNACTKGGTHRWKFNSGNPVCLKCGEFMPGEGSVSLPAHFDDDGVLVIDWPT